MAQKFSKEIHTFKITALEYSEQAVYKTSQKMSEWSHSGWHSGIQKAGGGASKSNSLTPSLEMHENVQTNMKYSPTLCIYGAFIIEHTNIVLESNNTLQHRT